ncbi:MAG: hydantoinase B/oxoprolinase family protein [Solirubrobacteraceae bacterium]
MSATEANPTQAGGPEPRSPETEEFLNALLTEQPVMYGPDPAIMSDHRIHPRTAREESAMEEIDDPAELAIAQSRIEAILESAKDMLQQIAAAPAAKWGDLTVGVYSREGDLSLCTSSGVNIFSAAASPVPKFINRYWASEPTVGVREGDVFYHNDSHYGGAHNPDHTLLLPLFIEGEHIAWVGTVVHEGENGAIDPGGFAPRATDPYGEGLRIPPMKIGEGYTLRRDVVNMFQNHVRDPLVWLIDVRAKLAGARNVERRLKEFMAERSADLLVATLRAVLENTETEVRRRLRQWPDGIYRAVHFGDCTLLEERLYKVAVELEKRGERLVMRTHGTAPAIDRAMNAQAHATKSLVGNEFMNFLFADLPRNAGFVSAIDFELEPGTILTAGREHPTSLSMLAGFYLNTTVHTALMKALFSNPGVVEVIAPWYAMLPTLQYGGLTQHQQLTANISVELNAMGGGAHRDRDGEHAAAPFFATLADWGETEDRETEIPVLCLWRHIPADNHGFGKHRGGASVEWAYALWGSGLFAFMVTSTGARFPVTGGLFGGYGGGCTPLTVVKPEGGIEGLRAWLADGAPGLGYDAAEMVAEKPLAGEYEVTNPSRPAAPIGEGEIWIQRIGGGGGYGDPLERDPSAVMTDLRRGLISAEVARDVYHVAFDPERGEVDERMTSELRASERQARIARGLPYDEFVERWRRDAPPEDVPYLGSWEWPESGP